MSDVLNRASDEQLEKLRRNFGANGTFSSAGIGVSFRGKSYLNEFDRAQNIQLTTRWIILFWLAAIPLGSYRIRRTRKFVSGTGRMRRNFELFSQEKLAWSQVITQWTFSLCAIILVGVLWWYAQ